MNDVTKIVVVALLFLVGSHLFLWSFLKRTIRNAQAKIDAEAAAEGTPAPDAGPNKNQD